MARKRQEKQEQTVTEYRIPAPIEREQTEQKQAPARMRVALPPPVVSAEIPEEIASVDPTALLEEAEALGKSLEEIEEHKRLYEAYGACSSCECGGCGRLNCFCSWCTEGNCVRHAAEAHGDGPGTRQD